ncbi:STAS domain-containing protein [Mycobacterium sp.]|uniref:STAS domain-containing protein n=1 Tax=Mycobacterium sp. TaxID=1785 RepID=UPI002D4BD2F4|nr:STAS domain-containing protein [Mycobacterium sp.]HZA09789.1 STAS domain-containing protein [Mycobacterium sp.]
MSETLTAGTHVLVAQGVLDSATYLGLRDRIIKAALDDARAVIIDVTELGIPAESALAVFTSARWHVGQWSNVPIALVCSTRSGRHAIGRNGITRYVPVYPTVGTALDELSHDDRRLLRRRARTKLPAITASVAHSREFVAEWLTYWQQAEFIAVAKMIVTVFVENVLAHTDSEPAIRLETDGATVTVAVDDGSTIRAGRREEPDGRERVSGLAIVAALSRRWGNAPTPTGKTVWAVIGPENRL